MAYPIKFEDENNMRSYVANAIIDGSCPILKRKVNTVLEEITIGNYGRIDILALWVNNESKTIFADVFELKNTTLKKDDIIQVGRYIKGLEQADFGHSKYDVAVSGHLVGMNIETSQWVYLLDMCPTIDAWVLNVGDTGFCWHEESSYSLINEGLTSFNEKIKKVVGKAKTKPRKTKSSRSVSI